MCLITKNAIPLTAKDDIVCYKVLAKYGGAYKTPFKLMHVDDDIIEGKKNLVAEGMEDIRGWTVCGLRRPSRYEINGGFIHCYTDHESAIERADFSVPKYEPFVEMFVFECIIPKGTTYYEGNSWDICAKEIKFVKEVYSITI